MTTDVKSLLPLPGGVAAGDALLALRPGAPVPYTIDPGTITFSVAAFSAVLAQLPTSSPAAGGPWLNGGVLVFGNQSTGGSGSGADTGAPDGVVVNTDGTFVVNTDGTNLGL